MSTEYTENDPVAVHLPCEDCGSSDALTLYSDGHTYCFSCQTRHNDNKELPKVDKKAPKNKALLDPKDMNITSLRARGLSGNTCRKYGYFTAFVNGEPCQVACYKDDSGSIIGQKLRFKDKKFSCKGNLKNRFFGQDLFSTGKKLVITEGEIDCLSVSQVQDNKYPVVSLPNGISSAKRTFEAQLEWLSGFEEVIVMFDNDEPGRAGVAAITNVLPLGKLKIATLPLKDANECLKAGRAGDIINSIWQAKLYRPQGIINGIDIREEILAEDDEAEKGYPFPWKIKAQKMTSGIRKGELTTITAGTGTGKTTFVRQLSYHLANVLGLSIGMVMLEENYKKTAKGIMSIHAEKNVITHRGQMSQEEYIRIYEETMGTGRYSFYKHFGSLEADSLINKIRFMVTVEKASFIVLDHISIAISGLETDNERKATDVLMTRLRSLVEETGVGLLLISHLKRVDGTPAEEGGRITLAHLRGSGAIAQLSDNVWALERDQQSDDDEIKNTTTLRILKNRVNGETGVGGSLYFDKDTNKFQPIIKKEIVAQLDREGNRGIECPF